MLTCAGQISVPDEPQATSSRPSTEAAVGGQWRGMLAKSGSPVCEVMCSELISSHGSGEIPLSSIFLGCFKQPLNIARQEHLCSEHSPQGSHTSMLNLQWRMF